MGECRDRGPSAAADGAPTDRLLPLLCVPDVQGSYAIPYIQSSPELTLRIADFGGRVSLHSGGHEVAKSHMGPNMSEVRFADLAPGEYELRLGGTGAEEIRIAPVGIGPVIAAIGDSITEGYHGQAFYRRRLELTAGDFPPAAVSRDRRNFPQFAPTAHGHKPQFNCFQSWMPRLNDLLSQSLGCPVFIANEGWGAFTAADYLKLMRGDRNWQERMRLLAPSHWLISLGVNDERAMRSATDVVRDMEAMVDILCRDHAARSENIFISRPHYDYWPGAADILQSYSAAIDDLIRGRRLSHGPDFFEAFSCERGRYYGDDPIHPNVEGTEYMARLWHDALAPVLLRDAAAATGPPHARPGAGMEIRGCEPPVSQGVALGCGIAPFQGAEAGVGAGLRTRIAQVLTAPLGRVKPIGWTKSASTLKGSNSTARGEIPGLPGPQKTPLATLEGCKFDRSRPAVGGRP